MSSAETSASPADPRSVWSPYQPDASRPWDLARAGHLLRRAGFGASWNQLQTALAQGPQRTIDLLLRPPGDVEAFERRQSELERLSADAEGSSEPCAQLWLMRIMQSPHPLLEKMTLFWHDYFGIAGARAGNGLLMQGHLDLLRRHALGKFDAMLEEICRDPATLASLQAKDNRKARPTTTFAAALLHQYTVGADGCTMRDVSEAARAFTGWAVVRHQFKFQPHEHDDSQKTVLGRTGKLDGGDVVKAAVAVRSTPQRMVRRVYRWLVSEIDEPADALLVPLVESFARDYDIGRLVETVLRSNHFFSPRAYRARVKSPVELAAGIILAMEGLVPATPLHYQLSTLGQRLLEPPTIEGWAGGRHWLNRYTMMARTNLAQALFAPEGTYGGKLDPQAIAQKHGASGAAAGRFLRSLLLQDTGEVAASGGDARQMASTIAASPEFQLA